MASIQNRRRSKTLSSARASVCLSTLKSLKPSKCTGKRLKKFKLISDFIADVQEQLVAMEQAREKQQKEIKEAQRDQRIKKKRESISNNYSETDYRSDPKG